MELWFGGEFGVVVDWLVGFDDGSEILWELLVKFMFFCGEVFLDFLGDLLGVNFGFKCGVFWVELWVEFW